MQIFGLAPVAFSSQVTDSCRSAHQDHAGRILVCLEISSQSKQTLFANRSLLGNIIVVPVFPMCSMSLVPMYYVVDC